MNLHPLAWCAWLAAVCVFAFAISNPYVLAVGLASVGLVHLASPPTDAPAGLAFGGFLAFGIGLLVLRIVFVSLVDAPGATSLVELPRIELAGIGVGGTVTGEVLVASAIEGLRLICVLAAFGVWTSRVELSRVVRMLPAAFRDAGLVVGIAAAFVPGLVRTARDVRDAQRLRGESGLRTLAPSLAVPVLGLTLERALLLAESMDARGYGHGATSVPSGSVALGLGGMLAGVAAWIAGMEAIASTLAIGGGAVVLWSLRVMSRASEVTRLASPSWSRRDVAVVAGAGVAVIAALVVPAAYSAHPVLEAPSFGFAAAVPGLLLGVPAAVEVAS